MLSQKDIAQNLNKISNDTNLKIKDQITTSNEILNPLKTKNIFSGLKSSMTYTKNSNQHSVDQLKDSLRTPESFGTLFHEDSNLQPPVGTTYRRNKISPGGSKSSAVPHSLIQKTIQSKNPYKPKDGHVKTWIDRMPERKKNQGLTYLQKKNTLERKMALEDKGNN